MTTGPEPTPRPNRAFRPAELPALIEDPLFLAGVDRERLLAGMAECWPDGVPAGTLAEDVHHLERLGVRPTAGRHGEWLSWLHLLLVSHGRAADAELLAGAGHRLPWRTVWSRWVPPGARAACRAPGGRVVGLRVVERDGTPVVSVQERYVLARPERTEPDDEDAYYAYAVDPADGTVLAGPRLYRPFVTDDPDEPGEPLLPEDLPELGTAALNGPAGWRGALLPAAPAQFSHAVRLDGPAGPGGPDGPAVFGGGWGCFAAVLDEEADGFAAPFEPAGPPRSPHRPPPPSPRRPGGPTGRGWPAATAPTRCGPARPPSSRPGCGTPPPGGSCPRSASPRGTTRCSTSAPRRWPSAAWSSSAPTTCTAPGSRTPPRSASTPT